MIPKTFNLVNRRYKVELLPPEIADELERIGDCHQNSAKIRIDTRECPESREHTFYHELAHALLYATTKPKLSKNEAFVDSLGAVIHQFLQTRKGEFK